MKDKFRGWDLVSENLNNHANDGNCELDEGQKASIRELAKRLPNNGVIIADEVGMGKTRIATTVAKSVVDAGGRVAILVPPGLGYQWNDELKTSGVFAPPILRSLWQYFQNWSSNESQEEKTAWFNESVLIISHTFANWRLGIKAAPWRWALLPEVYCKWRKKVTKRKPKYSDNSEYYDLWVHNAAQSIVEQIGHLDEQHILQERIKELVDKTEWPKAKNIEGSEYDRDSNLRSLLEQVVGLGLGSFDLIIMDEAHKSRGQDSGLNRLIDNLLTKNSSSRNLALTATPVELDATQWIQILKRINVSDESREKAEAAISKFTKSIKLVRQLPNDEKTRQEFKNASGDFQEKLNDYVLRRDKSKHPKVMKFKEESGEHYSAYREVREITIESQKLSNDWKQAICASEALSFVAEQTDNNFAKRLRLTIGNGHGISAILSPKSSDEEKESNEETLKIKKDDDVEEDSANVKQKQRVDWWQGVVLKQFDENANAALYHHPAILAAVEQIEEVCKKGEKVLVFGRFTKPLRALTQLLNAKEMLRRIQNEDLWPQSKLHENDIPAVLAACKQLEINKSVHALNNELDMQYKKLEAARLAFRNNLIKNIEEGFKHKSGAQYVSKIFAAFIDENNNANQLEGGDNKTSSLVLVARAMHDLMNVNQKNESTEYSEAFTDLITAITERDEGDEDGDGELDSDEASKLWLVIKKRLNDEYNRPEGGYARLMIGETKLETRRLLQLAFNRKHSFPNVLITQSQVGREGLNLHKACRTVILLHPEWNPAVVEQQIGRIDRIGSLWEEKLEEALESDLPKNKLPRIVIHPVVFKGTYDEKNWQVLNDRWRLLRAQLHGVVIESSPDDTVEYRNYINQLNEVAPRFKPCL